MFGLGSPLLVTNVASNKPTKWERVSKKKKRVFIVLTSSGLTEYRVTCYLIEKPLASEITV